MGLLSSILAGIIQGLTEFLPISSSGHLALFGELFGSDFGQGSGGVGFTVLLHLGTLMAVLIIYRRDVIALFPACFRIIGKIARRRFAFSQTDYHERLFCLLAVATLPIIAMAPLAGTLEKLVAGGGTLLVVGLFLILNGAVLLISDRLSGGARELSSAKPRHALLVGVCQAAAVFPGLSRSGATITGGLLADFKREDAVKFSFLMSIPATLGAAVIELPGFIANLPSGRELSYALTAALIAGVVGAAAVKILTVIARKRSFLPFALYSFAVGTAAITLFIIHKT